MPFSTFPEFTLLTQDNRKEYERFIEKYPPISDLSYATLSIWWNFEGTLAVASLNDNLVLRYYLPNDRRNSGLTLIGTRQVASTIKTILSELEKQGKYTRLVHVPEFVADLLQESPEFILSEEEDYKEYILPIAGLYPLENVRSEWRNKIRRFLKEVDGSKIEHRTLDLQEESNQALLLDAAYKWWRESLVSNDLRGDEQVALQVSVRNAQDLGIGNVCLFIDGELAGFSLYQISHNSDFFIGGHIKSRHDIPRIFDYLVYATAEKAHERGVTYINAEMDLGIPGLRAHKSELRPIGFYRKYRISMAHIKPPRLSDS
jgi:hypothetical protein